MLTLANERIDLLESQLNELQGERESRVNYQEKESDAKNKLSEVEIDQAELHNEMKQLKSTLRKIRQDLSEMLHFEEIITFSRQFGEIPTNFDRNRCRIR